MKIKQKKRDDILGAAIEIFKEHSFSAARVDDIAERANVSKRTLYNHFVSKQALFDAIVEQVLADVASIPVPEYQQKIPLREQLIASLSSYISIISDPNYIGLSRFLASEFMRDKELAKKILTRPEFYTSPIIRIIEGAVIAGLLKATNPQDISDQLLALVKNYYFWPQFMIGEDTVQDEKMLEVCIDLILTSYDLDVFA